MRIRALKPGFFKNEQLAELSPWHRLCFQGLWCCADRDGRLQDRPKRLKAEIFPYDDLDVNVLLWDLMQSGFIVRYQVNTHPFIWILNWSKHQHPRQDEGESTFPAYEPGSERVPSQVVTTQSDAVTVTSPLLPSHVVSTAPRMGQVEVGNGTSGNGNLEVGDGTAGVAAAPRSRAADVVALWNEITKPPIPRCRDLTDERTRKIRARLAKRPLLTEWRTVFEKVQASSFCRGETDRGGWIADFDWIIRNDTIPVRVLEGKYDDRDGGNGLSPTARYNIAAGDEAKRIIRENEARRQSDGR